MSPIAVALMFGAAGVIAFGSMFWDGARRRDLGWMSHAWLAEYHAAHR